MDPHLLGLAKEDQDMRTGLQEEVELGVNLVRCVSTVQWRNGVYCKTVQVAEYVSTGNTLYHLFAKTYANLFHNRCDGITVIKPLCEG